MWQREFGLFSFPLTHRRKLSLLRGSCAKAVSGQDFKVLETFGLPKAPKMEPWLQVSGPRSPSSSPTSPPQCPAIGWLKLNSSKMPLWVEKKHGPHLLPLDQAGEKQEP